MHTLLLLTLPFIVAAPPSEALGGWEINREYRFIWTKNQKKVGETVLTWAKVTRNGAEPTLEIRSARSYDDQGDSQRSKATTQIGAQGKVERFEETLEFTAQNRGRSQQKTTIEIAAGKAKVQFQQNENAKKVELEVDADAQTHLTASQSVEHWVLLAARLPKSFDKRTEKVFYPDFGKITNLSFEKAGTETLRIAAGEVKATRYQFAAVEINLQGTIWRDEQGRLIQIEFPNKLNPLLSLRVVLAEEKPASSKN